MREKRLPKPYPDIEAVNDKVVFRASFLSFIVRLIFGIVGLCGSPCTLSAIETFAKHAEVGIATVAAALIVYLAEISLASAAHQFLHENIYLANIPEINPLSPGHFVIALKSTGKNSSEVVLGEVLTMYTKNTMHDWLPMATSVGSPSYVSIIQIPRTHVLFSLAFFSRTIQRQAVPTTEDHPHVLLTLWDALSALFQKIRAQQLSLHSAVAQLMTVTKAKNVESGPLNSAGWHRASMMDHVEEQEENEDGGEEDLTLIYLCTRIYTVPTSKLRYPSRSRDILRF
ncbi:hypothetical protein DFH09DRAFT_1070230 [Mycena vulgaris]|nr:hypothetical protein DFH09DRAFT_1070230 [Mycena vulgaris]